MGSERTSKSRVLEVSKCRIDSTLQHHYLEKKLDGCRRRLLRYSLGLVWTNRVCDVNLAQKYPMEASVFLQERRLRLADHCFRSKQPVSQLLFWDHSLEMYDPRQVRNTKGKLVWQMQCSVSAGGSGNYTKLLMRGKRRLCIL